MKIAITGASGLVGRQLKKAWQDSSYEVFSLVRRKETNQREIYWNPDTQEIEKDKLEGIDVVIHLAGKNISSGRWTKKQKHRILESRKKGTRLIANTIAHLQQQPKVFLSASAVGFYGNHPFATVLTEKSSQANDFLAEVCSVWEKETIVAEAAGIRVIHLRFGVILSKDGGALQKMLLPFQLGLGGKIASGKQAMSWISINEIPRILQFLIQQEQISGAVNVVSPNPVNNQQFTKILGKVLHRPTFIPLPGFALKLLFGEMAQFLLIEGNKVLPEKLLEHGYSFRDAELEQTLSDLLNP
ncbi:TIGR01777 family oxidoreductase [Bacillaceae bacterium Marseille-Q3522]|nr:TIGR01777 family oxidoreductase [Bacillaceae bacterium Marseille-Q3522]